MVSGLGTKTSYVHNKNTFVSQKIHIKMKRNDEKKKAKGKKNYRALHIRKSFWTNQPL